MTGATQGADGGQQSVVNANNGESSTPNDQTGASEQNPGQGGQNNPQVVKRLIGQREKLRNQNSNLNGQVSDLNVENSDLASELVRLAQENKLLKTQVNPTPQSGTPPTLEQCEGDIERFQAETARFYASQVGQVVDQKINHLQTTQAAQANDAEFNQAVNGHYDRAAKMGVQDYEQAESNALNILGNDLVNEIVKTVPNSNELLYMLGSDSNEAYRVKNLLDQNPVRATVELGILAGKAGGFKKEQRPDPETDISGGQQPNVAHANLKKQYDAAIEKAAQTGDNSEVRALRKQMREAGVPL